MMYDSGALRFHEHLTSLGIPFTGVNGTGPDCLINFKPEATQAQIDLANAERLTFDWPENGEGAKAFRAGRLWSQDLVAFAQALKDQIPAMNALNIERLRQDFVNRRKNLG